jgi:hypothetical protein
MPTDDLEAAKSFAQNRKSKLEPTTAKDIAESVSPIPVEEKPPTMFAIVYRLRSARSQRKLPDSMQPWSKPDLAMMKVPPTNFSRR